MLLKTGIFGLVIVFLILPGCSSLKPGEMSYSVAAGDLVAVEAAEFGRVRMATMEAMRELGLHPMERQGDALSALICGEVMVGVIPQEREIRVRLSQLTESTTEIRMRILFTRNREKLEWVLQKIRKNLKESQGSK